MPSTLNPAVAAPASAVPLHRRPREVRARTFFELTPKGRLVLEVEAAADVAEARLADQAHAASEGEPA